MSLHLEASPGAIAPLVLIAGDPLRAKHIAETQLERAVCYNRIRHMLGYTGYYRGQRLSVQGTGIGIPSTALYLHELIHEYGVKVVMRVGTCGAIQPELELGSVIIASRALTDSAAVRAFSPAPSPMADPDMMNLAQQKARLLNIPIEVGPLFSTDLFYSPDTARYQVPAAEGVLGVDMETAMLYAMASHYGIRALALLTVSDNIITGATAPAVAREKHNESMMQLALELAADLAS